MGELEGKSQSDCHTEILRKLCESITRCHVEINLFVDWCITAVVEMCFVVLASAARQQITAHGVAGVLANRWYRFCCSCVARFAHVDAWTVAVAFAPSHAQPHPLGWNKA